MKTYFLAFLQNAYYHCLQYVVNKRLHWFERLFWVIWIFLSMVGVVIIVHQSVEKYYTTKASIRVRTDYLDMRTPFPSIFFCETDEIEGKAVAMLEELNFAITEQQALLDIPVLIKKASFIRPFESERFDICEKQKPNKENYCNFVRQYNNNLSMLLKYMKASCEEIFTSCLYNENQFDCCEHFIPIDTYDGKCFAFNSFNAVFKNRTRSNSPISWLTNSKGVGKSTTYLPFKLIYSKINPANLSIELAHRKMSVWFMDNSNIPTKMYQKDNQFILTESKMNADIFLQVQEVVPDNSVYNLGVERRNCRFWHEKDVLKSFQIYSNSACELECLRNVTISVCGCVLHFLPNENNLNDKICDLSGLMCVNIKEQEHISTYLKFNCTCLGNCHIFEVFQTGRIYRNSDDIRFRNKNSKARLNFITPAPTVQYVRHAYQEPLDVIVSIGGAISLFIGCSFLSLGQIIYYFLLKPLSERYLIKDDTHTQKDNLLKIRVK